MKRTRAEDEDTPILDINYHVEWNPAWQPDHIIIAAPSGPQSLETFNHKHALVRLRPRLHPPAAPHIPTGWNPQYTSCTTTPINPDLDASPTGATTFTQHPNSPKDTLIHDANGKYICTLPKARLQKLHNLYNHTETTTPLPEAIVNLIHRTNTSTHANKVMREIHFASTHKNHTPPEVMNGSWPIPDDLYDVLHQCFQIQRVLHYSPINVPLRAKTYTSHDPKDAAFSAMPHTPTAWSGISLTLPEHKPNRLTTALEQAI